MKLRDLGSGDKTIRGFNVVKDKNKYEGAFSIRKYDNGKLRNDGIFGYFANTEGLRDNDTLTIYDDFKYKETQ